MNISIS